MLPKAWRVLVAQPAPSMGGMGQQFPHGGHPTRGATLARPPMTWSATHELGIGENPFYYLACNRQRPGGWEPGATGRVGPGEFLLSQRWFRRHKRLAAAAMPLL